MQKIADYKNGNVHIVLYEDGTRIMESDDDVFDFAFPTNVDMTITHSCVNECPYCYLGCNRNGEHADLLKVPFLDTLRPGTELAINLNNCDHPQLERFLKKMRNRGVFVNGTVNQIDFEKHEDMIKEWCYNELLWGVGISAGRLTPEFVSKARKLDNTVIHVINGILTGSDIELLRDNGLKLLILGYKDVGKGTPYKVNHQIDVTNRQRYLQVHLPTLFQHFEVISFDNLAIEQLNVRRLLTDEEWETFYQGDEGTSTFAVDLVNKTFAMNSTATDPRFIHPIQDDVTTMFATVKDDKKVVL